MNFHSVRDLRTDTRNMWKNLSSGDGVVITSSGRPSALMIDIPEGAFDEIVQAVRQAKAMAAFNSMRAVAAENGYMDDDEIESEVSAARRERRERQHV